MSKREGLRVDRGALGGYAILYTATAAGPNSFKKKKKKRHSMTKNDAKDSGNQPTAGARRWPKAGRLGLRSIIVGATLSMVVAAAAFAAVSFVIPWAQDFGAGFSAADPVAQEPAADPGAASPGTEPPAQDLGNRGVVTTLAGGGPGAEYEDEPGAGGGFNGPQGVAVDSAGTVYVADTTNQLIRKITPAGVVTTLAGSITYDDYGYPGAGGFADGTGPAARFEGPTGVAVDSSGVVYVADGNRIRKITTAGVVTTLAGSGVSGFADGVGAAALFSYPSGVAVDSAGTVYVADTSNHRIRKITPAGVVTTLAGSVTLDEYGYPGPGGFADGTGPAARFEGPSGVAVDAAGTVYVADRYNNRIRKITPAGVVTTLAGPTGGLFGGEQFDRPGGVAVDSAGTVYVADSYNYRIRKITPAGVVTTLAGSGKPGHADGTGTRAQFGGELGIAVDSAGAVYVADSFTNRIRKIQ